MVEQSAKIKEIDISRAAGALGVVRFTEYVLVMTCGSLLLRRLNVMLFGHEEVTALVLLNLLEVIITSLAVYTAYRNIGVINVRTWKAFTFFLPILFLFGVLYCVLMLGGQYVAGDLWKVHAVTAIMPYFFIALAALSGFISILLLKRMQIAPLGISLVELLFTLYRDRGLDAVSRTHIRDTPRGLAYAMCACILLYISVLLQPQLRPGISDPIALSGFFLLIRARRYFQVDADTLLAYDKRKPILFLRSFTMMKNKSISIQKKRSWIFLLNFVFQIIVPISARL